MTDTMAMVLVVVVMADLLMKMWRMQIILAVHMNAAAGQAMVNLLKGINLESRNLDQDVNSCGNNERATDKRNQVLGVLFHDSIAMP
ncbi:hypothetical protein HanXRQr2_Chr17g0823381 [Helianthus annuus]|uniref:Uncharacterized protein n=1 Tax=Helianthus annuus TaxID=4232 RepID=A0A9K3GWW4_HELAN|nr:hypothetical protein HanXRQr2_Chr17g0823381 [Helianthus annuus]